MLNSIGILETESIISKLNATIQKHSNFLNKQRAEKRERDSSRLIREQQDMAYQQSLQKWTL